MFVKVVGVLVGTLLVLQNANGQSCVCKCGPTGLLGNDDDLGGAPAPKGPLVIRPKALARPNNSWPLLSSFKGPCFRKQAIVKPAVVPRPVYVPAETVNGPFYGGGSGPIYGGGKGPNYGGGSGSIYGGGKGPNYGGGSGSIYGGGNGPNSGGSASPQDLASAMAAAAEFLSHSASSSSSSTSSQAQGVFGARGIDVASAYNQAVSGNNPTAPADPVSLAIALKHTHNNYNKKIAEDKLAYGFRKLPIEIPAPDKPKEYKHILPEESLYTLNGQIVELKPVSEQQASGTNCDTLAEEAEDELLDLAISEEAKDHPAGFARKPSLGELGYGPAKLASPTFVDVSSGSDSGSSSNGGFFGAAYPGSASPNAGYPGAGYPGSGSSSSGFPGAVYPDVGYPGAGYPGAGFAGEGSSNGGFSGAGSSIGGSSGAGSSSGDFSGAGYPGAGSSSGGSGSFSGFQDGFKAGNVIYKHKYKPEPIIREGQHPFHDDASCESREEPVKHISVPNPIIGFAAPSCQCNLNGNLLQTHVHKSSSSSSSSSHHKKIVLL